MNDGMKKNKSRKKSNCSLNSDYFLSHNFNKEIKSFQNNKLILNNNKINNENNSLQLINNQNYFNKSNSLIYKKSSKDNIDEYVSEKISESNYPIENPDKRLSINQDNTNLSKYFDLDLSFCNNKKQKRFHEFFINDNQKNFKLKHPNNKLSTTKYNIFTFFPKSLIIQFVRLSNVYFLTTAIIQSIPIISPLTSYTAIVPLIFVLSVSIIREFIEDFSRLKYDNMNNNEEVYVFRNGEFIKSISETIKVGEIILIKEGENVPCDIILIDSNLNDGLCYVETSNLDGEKNLKNKLCNILTYGLFCEKNHVKFEKIFTSNKIIKKNILISGFVQCDLPNVDLNKIDGNITININNKEIFFPLTINQTLLKGSIIKNSGWVIGIALYTGRNCKLILNSKQPRVKLSIIEKKLNKYLIGIFIFLMILCLICSIFYYENYKKNKKFYNNFILSNKSATFNSIIIFFTYFLLLNTLIPISLIITIEIVKIIQGFFINWDVELFSFVRKKFAKAKSISIIEELGNVNYIFSDKTGTLTCNKMQFKYCVIGKRTYELILDNSSRKDNNNKIKEDDLSKNSNFNYSQNFDFKNFYKNEDNYIKFSNNFFYNLIKYHINYLNDSNLANGSKSSILNREENKLFQEDIININEFWTALSVTNECLCEIKNNKFVYTGTSPDDIELVKSASNQGYILLKSGIGIKNIRFGNIEKKYNILNVLTFNSQRKRMSIILKDENGTIKLYIKGADCEIKKRLSKKNKNLYVSNIIKKVDEYSSKGYRTLLVAYKILSKKEYSKWHKELKSYEMNLQEKDKLIQKVYDKIENDFILLGATIVEDKLQDGVPETIKQLLMAGIKIWVLTGDKADTAENIALSCNLINRNQKIFKFISEENKKNNIENFKFKFNELIKEFKNFKKLVKKEDEILDNDNLNSINFLNFNKTFQPVKNNSKHKRKESNNIVNSINSSIFSNNKLFKKISKNKFYEESMLNYRDEKNKIPLFSILIEGSFLSYIFSDSYTTHTFLEYALNAGTVICCRVSPIQKSLVIKEVKKIKKHSVTLAIGDGGNDVSMIMEANIGIGIYGEEGIRAVQASDFAIGEFKYLKKLLFFHGRTNNNRIGNLIIYFFYKNFFFTMTQFIFGFFCLMSGQTIVDDWYITCYNLIFTALPLIVQALSDLDVLEKDDKDVKRLMPQLYRESRDDNAVFNLKKLLLHLFKGLISSFISFIIISFADLGVTINKRGDYANIWYMSLKIYTNIIISVSITLFLNIRYIIILFPIVMLISTFLLYIGFLFVVHYLLMFNSCASILGSLTTLRFYFEILLGSSMQFIADYCITSCHFLFENNMAIYLMNSRNNKDNVRISETLQSYFLNRSKYSRLYKGLIINDENSNKREEENSEINFIQQQINSNSLNNKSKSLKINKKNKISKLSNFNKNQNNFKSEKIDLYENKYIKKNSNISLYQGDSKNYFQSRIKKNNNIFIPKLDIKI